MIDHASIGVRDLAAATAFYEQVLATIGLQKLVARRTTVGFGKTYPEFWLNARPGVVPVADDGGSHLCLRARSRDQVDDFYEVALALGAEGDGAPGIRSEYSEGYYAAFIRDADGHRIEVVTFLSAARQRATASRISWSV